MSDFEVGDRVEFAEMPVEQGTVMETRIGATGPESSVQWDGFLVGPHWYLNQQLQRIEDDRPDDDPAPTPTCNGRDCGGRPHE